MKQERLVDFSFSEKGNKYDLQELVKAVRILREVERGIKIGQIDAELAIDYVLVNIL